MEIDLILFLIASWALVLTPGQDFIFVITRAISTGRRAGVLCATGVTCGIFVHTLAAALGLTLILQTSQTAFLLVKYLGAGYLIYLGIQAWYMGYQGLDFKNTSPASQTQNYFWQGVLCNVLNPKIAIFFLAFLPQFVDTQQDNASLQIVFLGGLYSLFSIMFLLPVSLLSGYYGRQFFSTTRSRRWLYGIAGTVMVGLGLRLMLEEKI